MIIIDNNLTCVISFQQGEPKQLSSTVIFSFRSRNRVNSCYLHTVYYNETIQSSSQYNSEAWKSCTIKKINPVSLHWSLKVQSTIQTKARGMARQSNPYNNLFSHEIQFCIDLFPFLLSTVIWSLSSIVIQCLSTGFCLRTKPNLIAIHSIVSAPKHADGSTDFAITFTLSLYNAFIKIWRWNGSDDPKSIICRFDCTATSIVLWGVHITVSVAYEIIRTVFTCLKYSSISFVPPITFRTTLQRVACTIPLQWKQDPPLQLYRTS
jgi:hypothetical protein